MTADEYLKQVIGRLVIENAILAARIDELTARLPATPQAAPSNDGK